jgi:hypothetical protein
MYFTLRIACDNDAFTDEPGAEVAELLRTAATRVEAGRTDATIQDTNGATVGAWTFVTEPDDEPDGAPAEQWQVTEPPEVYATDDDDDPNDLLGGAKR